MTETYAQIAMELGAAWLAGGLIGAERSYHGRAAGFRTHALVALAAASTMLVTHEPQMAQGVMTGIGFLGAGVIFKEGVNVQGLTTAASVWAMAAVGLLFGVGDYAAGAMTTAGVFATLVVMRWVEDALPTQVYAWAVLRFRATAAPDKDGLLAMLGGFGVSLRDVSYSLSHDGAVMEFSGNIIGGTERCFDDLAGHLRGHEGVAEFELSRISK
ncbi:MgtC/SapB family protein [Phenylobacterium sp.]|uniref:MgtC/SapB family protein n=1 Tax=Phenylobacterium sp. TaxID=1871053 RepID=UPI00121C3715|nr:MgtC/SapB family protein [Phenylobacterium sp.]THD64772.1 MAG: MgtC/SapB family protein [Phenylobacterium sp.]